MDISIVTSSNVSIMPKMDVDGSKNGSIWQKKIDKIYYSKDINIYFFYYLLNLTNITRGGWQGPRGGWQGPRGGWQGPRGWLG